MTNRGTWDAKALRESFDATAREKDRYLTELRAKMERNPSYEFIYDETLAEFHAANNLAGRGSDALRSRESLVDYLQQMKEWADQLDSTARDKQRFAGLWKNNIQRLIDEYTSSSPTAA